jgi:squalene-hopene/tetraprenyl-beta-curcumene cyclase
LSVGLVDTLLQRQDRDGGWGTPDITGMIVEAIAANRGDAASAAARRAVEYLRAAQRPDGSWVGTAGAIHATSHAIHGLLVAGVDDGDDAIVAAVNWLAVHQEQSGGWDNSTSRTSLALLALTNAGRANRSAALRAVSFLLDAQQDDGRWDDPQCVHRDPATNRPVRNDVLNVALPLEALSRWIVAANSAQLCGAPQMSLRLVSVTT